MKQPEKKGKGIRIKHVNIAMIVLALAAALLLLIINHSAIVSYRRLQVDTDLYVRALKDASDMQLASDYLTRQAQAYTVTGDPEYIDLYFEEAFVTCRRDNAIGDIRDITTEEAPLGYLEQAMTGSIALMEKEYLAMRLASESFGAASEDLPEELKSIELTEEQALLSGTEKRDLAREMVFGADYLREKDEIKRNVDLCTESLTELTSGHQQTSSDFLLRMLVRQYLLTAFLLLVIAAVMIAMRLLVISPLEHNVKSVNQAEYMQVKGSHEMRFLEESYNELYRRMQQDYDKLSYEATHDPLTGVLNRKAYEVALENHEEYQLAMIMVDVDDFKKINDRHGHPVGDEVLKRVAEVLSAHFRAEDYVCRIGGDEFAVLMVHMSSELRALVEDKVTHIATLLRRQVADMPPITLSIGVAFGDQVREGSSLYASADLALYHSKEKGRDCYTFYETGLKAKK